MKLTLKQQRFADEYIISGNITQSLLRAGYSETYAKTDGCKLLVNPSVKTYIDQKLAELQSQKIAKQEEVLEYLTSIMRGEAKEEVLYGVGNGEQNTRRMEVGAKDRIKAAELLGKRYALFTEKAEMTTESEICIKVSYED